MLFCSLTKYLWFSTRTWINKSPDLPPLIPASPKPSTIISWLFLIPAGIVIFVLTTFEIVLFPLHSLHLDFIIFPNPEQFWHICVELTIPKGVLFWMFICP